MIKKVLLLVVTAFAFVALPATQANAGNPNRFDDPAFINLFPDPANGVSVFVNITARDFCKWVSDGEQGPPPALEPVTVQGKQTGKGAIVGSVKADLYIELWQFDDGVPPLVGPCEDIAKQLANPDAEPFATGRVSYQGHDNDRFGSETRGNSFGDSGRAVVEDGEGNEYSYNWRFHVNSRCNAPEDGPPACLWEDAVLRAR